MTPKEIIESGIIDKNRADPRHQYHKINVQQLSKTPIFLDCLRAPAGYKFVQWDACYDESTELLTKSGWKLFSQVTTKDLVWQVDPGSLLGEWAHPSRVIWKDYSGRMYAYGNRRGALHVTQDHTMLWVGQQTRTRKDKVGLRKVTKAQDLVPKSTTTVMTSTLNCAENESCFTDWAIWMSCMLAADGHQTPTGKYVVEFSNQKKRVKAAELLSSRGIVKPPRGTQEKETETWCAVDFVCSLLDPQTKKLRLDKLAANQARTFVEALSYWDSYKTPYKTGRFIFHSTDEQQIDHIQQYLVRSGYEAKKYKSGTPRGNHKQCWSLSIRKAAGIRLRKDTDVEVYDYTGKVGCVTVPSGFILVRREGQTFISGNCSLEPTVLAELSGCPTYKEIYASDKPHDSYLFVACRLLDPKGELGAAYNPANPSKQTVKAAKKQFKRLRSIAKVFQLMSTFKAGAAAIHRKLLLEDIDITREEVEKIKEEFWGPKLFAQVLEYELDLLQQVQQNDGYYLNALGIPIVVTDKQERKIINTQTQSVGHGILDLWLWQLDVAAADIEYWPVIPDYHDEGVFLCKESFANELAQKMLVALQKVNDMLQWEVKIQGDPEITDDFTEFKQPDPSVWYSEKLNV